MATFNPKKLQVFVSSTYTDLREERQAAVEAILTAGHIPAGMELFTAGDESQMQVIKQWIDESDVYLLILGGRYGSIEPKTAKSYIQLEYEYALSEAKPLFACVIRDEAIEVRVKAKGRSVIETENPQKLKEFRAQVLSKLSKFWEDSKDIKITVAETLSSLARREDLTGWVRPNTQSNVPALADEIARLSKENAHLRAQVANASGPIINGLTFPELYLILERTGALKFLTTHARAMAGNPDGTRFRGDLTVPDELCFRGLLSRRSDGYSQAYLFSLTDAGRSFLNKLDALRLEEERASSPAKDSGSAEPLK